MRVAAMLFDDGGVRLFTPAAATATRATTPAATARLIAIKDADTAGAATTQVARHYYRCIYQGG
jgi:hypothetical protein